MATLLSPDMLPEDIRNMDFGQASMPHAPEAQTPEVPYDTTTSAPDRPAIPLSPDMLSGNLRENDSEKSGIEFSFDAFGYTQQVELVQESYADGNLAVTAYLSDPTDESFGQPWSSVTVNFGSPLQQDATVFLDTNNMGEAMLSKISQLGAFTGQFMRSGFCSYPAFLRYDPRGTTHEPCEGGAIGMSRFHSNRTCIRSPTAILSSQNTPLC